jgi:ketosteroid isomerase-like protein
MAHDLVQKTWRAYAAMAQRDMDAILELCDLDCEFTSLTRESEGAVYRGHEGVREFLGSLVEVLPDWTPEIERIEEHDDQMLVKARIRATPPGGSVPVEQVMWQTIRFRNGRALRWDFFRTEEEARAALAAPTP